MASSGAAAWVKYFQGRGDIPTTLKKPSGLFEVDNQNKRIGEITAGTQIVYLASPQYESKPTIKFKKLSTDKKFTVARVSFDCIAKPGVKSSGAVSLKPQSFNVRDKKYSISEYKSTVKAAIEEHPNLSGELKTFLTLLFDYYSNGGVSESKVTTIFKSLKDNLPINDISKDFGEVLGPVAIPLKGVLRGKGFIIPASAQVYLPERPNEPLMDYAFYSGKKTYIISAKSGTTTNVVKPADIISLLNRDPVKIRKWQDTQQYQVLRILAENNILTGPIRAVGYLFPNLIPAKAIKSLDLPYNKSNFNTFISQNEYLSKRDSPTLNEIMYECEKLVQKETKTGTLNMNDIFADAIDGIVYYVKFEMDARGIGIWDTAQAPDIRKVSAYGRVFLRSKNGYTRAGDRMGIQV